MKINTDGALLGALSNAGNPRAILDIGSGTGVVALMLAQRFPEARVDAVEIEKEAAERSALNFQNSPFSERLSLYPESFQAFSENHPDKKYDLIVSNPPFFLHSLKNPDKGKQTARHTDNVFFEDLIRFGFRHLNPSGIFSLILPQATAELCEVLAAKQGLHVQQLIHISSFKDSSPHRLLISFGFEKANRAEGEFVIYSLHREYSGQFANALKEFFTIF